jgi:hypothetical protein
LSPPPLPSLSSSMACGGIWIRLPRLIQVVRPAGSELEVMSSGGSQQWGRRQPACDNPSPLSSRRPRPSRIRAGQRLCRGRPGRWLPACFLRHSAHPSSVAFSRSNRHVPQPVGRQRI